MNDLAPTLAAFARPVLQPLGDDTPLMRREPGRSLLTQIAEELLARKKEQYAGDVRIIVRWDLTEVEPGQLSLLVEGAPAA